MDDRRWWRMLSGERKRSDGEVWRSGRPFVGMGRRYLVVLRNFDEFGGWDVCVWPAFGVLPRCLEITDERFPDGTEIMWYGNFVLRFFVLVPPENAVL